MPIGTSLKAQLRMSGDRKNNSSINCLVLLLDCYTFKVGTSYASLNLRQLGTLTIFEE